MSRKFATVILAVAGSTAAAQNVSDSLINGAWSGQVMAVRSALESGRVDVDVRTSDGSTALMFASLAGHESVVTVLLDNGADPKLANEAGETPLILAVKYGFTAVARKLLDAGAAVDARDASERSAWTWARFGKNEELASLLESAGADTSAKTDPFQNGGAPVDRFEKPPELTKYRAPKMPKDLKGAPLDGTIILSLVAGRDGKPKAIDLEEGLAEALDRAALEAAEKWRFEPGEVQGQPVDGRVRLTLRYLPALGEEPKVGIQWTRWRY
jgi:TonB family protein